MARRFLLASSRCGLHLQALGLVHSAGSAFSEQGRKACDWTGSDNDGDERRRDCAETGRLLQALPFSAAGCQSLLWSQGTVWRGARGGEVPVLCVSTQTRIKHSLALTIASDWAKARPDMLISFYSFMRRLNPTSP